FLSLAGQTSFAQTVIIGKVKSADNKAIAFANVFVLEIYDGATTDEEGNFSFRTESQGSAVLVASYTGYESDSLQIQIQGDTLKIDFKLLEDAQSLDPVTISAGSFEASDEKKMTILKPLDIVTVAGSQGDIYQALKTLPGVAQAGDETGILVRGGEAYETRTILNGTIQAQPFFGEVPDIPSRGRFNPFIFKETSFSTGGYSAEYGQALSSVIILKTQDIPNRESTGLSVTAAGLNLNHSQLFGKNSALLVGGGYTNLIPLFELVPQNADWIKPPEGYGGSIAYRHRTSNSGMFKTYLQFQSGKQSLSFPDLEQPAHSTTFKNKNQDIYWNSNYQGLIFKDWLLYAAFTFSHNKNDNLLDNINLVERES
ncbi:MAG: TonB-dependent receptor, partial [Bacteroidota bacterium]